MISKFYIICLYHIYKNKVTKDHKFNESKSSPSNYWIIAYAPLPSKIRQSLYRFTLLDVIVNIHIMYICA